MNDEVYTVDEVAKRLRVNKATVYVLLKDGAIRGIKVGRHWRITQSAFTEYLNAQ